MKKNTLIAALIAMILVCVGCKKEEPTPPATAEDNTPTQNDSVPTAEDSIPTAEDFAGSYTLDIDYVGYMEGADDEYGSFTGTMTITAIDTMKVEVLGMIKIGSQSLPLYSTTGEVDNKGVLKLEPNTYTAGTNVFDVTYGDINLKSPLQFQTTMSLDYGGYLTTFEMDNTATKE